jgi:hypothetical protein
MKIALAKADGDCPRSGISGNPKSKIQNPKLSGVGRAAIGKSESDDGR